MAAQTDLRIVLTQNGSGKPVALHDSQGRVRVYDASTVRPNDPAGRYIQYGWADLNVTFDAQAQQ